MEPLEHPLEANENELVVFNAKEHQYETNLFSDKKSNIKINRIDSYYFSSKGNLLGLIPDTNTIMVIEGPFKNYNKQTNIIYTFSGDAYYLNRIETTKQPPLYDRTMKILKSLTK